MTPEEQLAPSRPRVREHGDAAPALPHGGRAARPGRARRDVCISELDELPSADREHLDALLPGQRLPGPHAARRRSRAIPFPTSRTSASRWPSCCAAPTGRSGSPGSRCRRSCRAGCRCRRPTSSCRSRRSSAPTSRRSFPASRSSGWYTFRITRNTDLQIDNGDEAEDLLSLIQEEVRNRRFARGGAHRGAHVDAAVAARSCCSPSSASSRSRRRGRSPTTTSTRCRACWTPPTCCHSRVARPAGAQGPGLPSGHAGASRRRRGTSST